MSEGIRQKAILNEIRMNGYYHMRGQNDLVTCRRLCFQHPEYGMKRIEGHSWYIFTSAGLRQLLKNENISDVDKMRLRRYARKMLSEATE